MVSVIMGIYNSDINLLKRAIYSILNGTFKELEFLICDDGSSNDCFEVLTQIAFKDIRVRIFKNNTNLGLAATLNRLINEAKYDIIVRQDDDDYSVPERIETLLPYLDIYAIVGSYANLYNDSGIFAIRKFKTIPTKKDFLFSLPFLHGTLAFQKSALVNVNCYTVAKYTKRAEDFDLLARLYAAGYVGYNVNKCLYCYKEDYNAYKKRTFRDRVYESYVKLISFTRLRMLLIGIPFVIKPFIVFLLPYKILEWLKDIYYNRNTKEM